jgi:hypothetical protein
MSITRKASETCTFESIEEVLTFLPCPTLHGLSLSTRGYVPSVICKGCLLLMEVTMYCFVLALVHN